MTPRQALALGAPVTVLDRTIVPVLITAHEAGERWGLVSAVPVAVLVLEGEDCWFAPLAGDFSQEALHQLVFNASWPQEMGSSG